MAREGTALRRYLSILLLSALCWTQMSTKDWATNEAGRYTSRGYGNRTCSLYLATRREQGDGGGFAVWMSGFLTAINQVTDGTEDILAGKNLPDAMNWLEDRCRKYPSATFAAVAHAFVEAQRGVAAPTRSPTENLDRKPAETAPPKADAGRSEPSVSSVFVQGAGSTSLIPFRCQDTPQGGYVQRLCYDSEHAHMLLQVGGIWIQFCGIKDEFAARLTNADALERFYKSERAAFACRPDRP